MTGRNLQTEYGQEPGCPKFRKLRSVLLSFHFRNTLTSTRKILTACSTVSLRVHLKEVYPENVRVFLYSLIKTSILFHSCVFQFFFTAVCFNLILERWQPTFSQIFVLPYIGLATFV